MVRNYCSTEFFPFSFQGIFPQISFVKHSYWEVLKNFWRNTDKILNMVRFCDPACSQFDRCPSRERVYLFVNCARLKFAVVICSCTPHACKNMLTVGTSVMWINVSKMQWLVLNSVAVALKWLSKSFTNWSAKPSQNKMGRMGNSAVWIFWHFSGDCLLRIAGFWSWALFAPKLDHFCPKVRSFSPQS